MISLLLLLCLLGLLFGLMAAFVAHVSEKQVREQIALLENPDTPEDVRATLLHTLDAKTVADGLNMLQADLAAAVLLKRRAAGVALLAGILLIVFIAY